MPPTWMVMTYTWVLRQNSVATNRQGTPKTSQNDLHKVHWLISVIFSEPAENLVEVYFRAWQIQVNSSQSFSVTPAKCAMHGSMETEAE